MPGLLTALIIKHFLSDFVFQTDYQYGNKGKFLHPGGLLHALITIASSGVVLYLFQVPMGLSVQLLAVEFVTHYLIDFGKVRIGKMKSWTPVSGRPYFMLLGLDQMLHYLTYAWMFWMVNGYLP